jgi:hypothetical protein
MLIQHIQGNSGDGQPQTSFGALDSTKVPWFVLPQDFYVPKPSHEDPHPKPRVAKNALGAIICNGKMFYAIFGDSK